MTGTSASASRPATSRATVVAQAPARRIVEYWLRHPQASDTVQGIREWWLGSEGGDALTERRVRDALEQLVACGVAEQVPGRFGQASGFRSALAVAELAALLASAPERGERHG